MKSFERDTMGGPRMILRMILNILKAANLVNPLPRRDSVQPRFALFIETRELRPSNGLVACVRAPVAKFENAGQGPCANVSMRRVLAGSGSSIPLASNGIIEPGRSFTLNDHLHRMHV